MTWTFDVQRNPSDKEKMSEDNQNEKAAESTETKTKKVREPKKNSIPAAEIKDLTDGIPQYEKASFLVVGHKNGVRIALPRTGGVSRAYFYGDYSIIPNDEAIRVFTVDERKEDRLGGITAKVDFEKGSEAARRALGKLIDVVRSAPAPAVKPKREPKPKTEETLPSSGQEAEGVDSSDAGTGEA